MIPSHNGIPSSNAANGTGFEVHSQLGQLGQDKPLGDSAIGIVLLFKDPCSWLYIYVRRMPMRENAPIERRAPIEAPLISELAQPHGDSHSMKIAGR
ncbi:hypothetical protein TgHK011_004373 [Trichoderma gracile]|nr:hypothetical protein TgHK011_004373 [Trichoderma gracile]